MAKSRKPAARRAASIAKDVPKCRKNSIKSSAVVREAQVQSPPSPRHWCLQWIGLVYVFCTIWLYRTLAPLVGIPESWAVTQYATAIVLSAAVWEALRPERLVAHKRFHEAVRTFLQFVGDLYLIPFYALLPAEVPVLGFQQTARNLEILAGCPTLAKYSQSPWLRNAYLAFVALIARDMMGAEACKANVRREILVAADGGEVALDWWEPEEGNEKADKILFIGSTFTGDALVTCTRLVCQHFSARGWRCVIMVKRGCGLTMPNTQSAQKVKAEESGPRMPWCLSGYDDIKLAVDHVANLFPGLPMAGVGFSVGAAQLRNYLNTTGEKSKLKSAVLLDIGPNWDSGMQSMDARVPLLCKALVGAADTCLQACGVAPDPANVKQVPGPLAGGLIEWVINRLAPAHGYERSQEAALKYLNACKPLPSSNCKVPCLEVLTLQDVLSTPDAIREVHSYHKLSPNVISVTTQEGTHMVRWEGWRPTCWISSVSAEFLESALRVVA